MKLFERFYKAFFFEDGKLSATRFWKHIAYGVTTWIVIHIGTDITWDVLALYLTVIAADNRAGAIIRAKFNTSMSSPDSRLGGGREKPAGDDDPITRGSAKTPEE